MNLRLVIEAILWIQTKEGSWRELPNRFGPWQSVYQQFRQFQQSGLWDLIYQQLQVTNNHLSL